ncbi:MAG: electron transfer flavoprotein subunit alpha/FixB family protein [Ardenticatenaceae bacterium]|nr:electron transfer flavoprotein subunit alpha/FixB family protein [Ardenticatenaceae bacterium]HBY97652.1 electron transfer flavoprotein subunit alpha/FixB family protein [Chloroflexota bacterium]
MILGLVEHDRGTLATPSLEMLTLARRLAEDLDTPLEAVLIGNVARRLADTLSAYGVTAVHLIQHDRLDEYAPEAWAESLVQLIDAGEPEAILAAGTDWGHEVMAHVAARANLPLATNCTKIRAGDVYEVTRLRWGGSLFEEARLKGEPKLLTVAPHAIAAETAPADDQVVVEVFTPTLAEATFRVRVTRREMQQERTSLADAKVVVGGGRGVGSEAGFAVLAELANLLGGVVGVSRVVTNAGWRPHCEQIGQTGTRIAPDIYIACGISGAVQHIVGCKGAKHILVINTDPHAPIIAKSDWAIIGDLHEVVPALSAAIRKAKQTS